MTIGDLRIKPDAPQNRRLFLISHKDPKLPTELVVADDWLHAVTSRPCYFATATAEVEDSAVVASQEDLPDGAILVTVTEP